MTLPPRSSVLQKTRFPWIQTSLRVAYLFAAFVPAALVLTHPMPVRWLQPICKGTWPIVAACALAAMPSIVFPRIKGRFWSLAVIALTQAMFQAWCYNTGSHPAGNTCQIWGIVPFSDAHLYYSGACELLNNQQISVMPGARHPYPVLLAVLLKSFMGDFRAVTSTFTIVMAVATWSAFEVIRSRLGSVPATVFLVCVTFYARIYCSGLFMTEQLGLLYSLCAVCLLVESIIREGKAKAWLYFGGLFFLTQALNARPAAYMTLPFLVVVTCQLFQGSLKARSGMAILSAVVVTTSLLLHSITYHETVASRTASNVWYCIYGLLNDGSWPDGLKRSQELMPTKPQLAPSDPQGLAFQLSLAALQSDRSEGLHLLREECLSEIRHHPGKLATGWWRALCFLWTKNTPFRSFFPEMPSRWFTEVARWSTVLGLGFSVFFLLRSKRLDPRLKRYQALSWLNLAAFLGMITSLPFAPPWDGETRVLAATVPLFFLLPASGVGALYEVTISKLRRLNPESNADPKQSSMIGVAGVIGGMLTLVITFGPWYLVSASSVRNGSHPVKLMIDGLASGPLLTSSIELRSLRAGYHLRLSDDSHPTWLPNISRKDFVHNIPQLWGYSALAEAFSRLPPGSEVVVLPYWSLLVLDKEDAQQHRFTPQSAQTGHVLWPPVYFSKGLSVQN